ncbi:MAG TPA: tetratricopeptide repeat protein, partial [Flavobacteriales bacterium]|nr:tetratricopeptide repeat protein [Flavobacteriales bacterium]
MKPLFALVPAIFLTCAASGQDQRDIDSLNALLDRHWAMKKELGILHPSLYDTSAALILHSLFEATWANDPDKAMEYAERYLGLSKQIGFKRGEGNAYNAIGVALASKGDYSPAMEYLGKALKVRDGLGLPEHVAETHSNIGFVYQLLGKFPEAIQEHLAALRICESTGNKSLQATIHMNLGSMLAEVGDHRASQGHFSQALALAEEAGNQSLVPDILSSAGQEYALVGDYPKALQHHSAALDALQESGSTAAVAFSYNAIGFTYYQMGLYDDALEYTTKALKLFNELESNEGRCQAYQTIGAIHYMRKEYGLARGNYQMALALSKQIGSFRYAVGTLLDLARMDSIQGNFQGALEHYKLHIAARDSLEKTENRAKITELRMQYDFDKKEAEAKAMAEAELKKQKLVRNGFVGGFGGMLLFAAVVYRQRNKTKKEKQRAEQEKERSDQLLLNIFPETIVQEIKTSGTTKAKAYTMATVMLTDFKDFTTVSDQVSAELLVDEIHTCFSAFDRIMLRHGIEKIKTIGDAYLCAGGLPVSNYTHATDMVSAALEIRDY